MKQKGSVKQLFYGRNASFLFLKSFDMIFSSGLINLSLTAPQPLQFQGACMYPQKLLSFFQSHKFQYSEPASRQKYPSLSGLQSSDRFSHLLPPISAYRPGHCKQACLERIFSHRTGSL